jgi:hypothetical protein
VQVVWSELESGLISWVRTDHVMLPVEKHKSIVEGRSPFRERWVGWPGLLWKRKLWDSLQSVMVFDYVLCIQIWGSSMLPELPHC